MCSTYAHYDFSCAGKHILCFLAYNTPTCGMPGSPVAVRACASISAWPTTAVSCPTALGAVCGQLTFRLFMVPRTPSSYGDRTFAAAGPRLWNSLPVQLRNPDVTYVLFRRQLRRHLFGKHEHGTVTSDMRRHGKTLTWQLFIYLYY